MADRFAVEFRSTSLSGNTLAGRAAVFGVVANLPGHYERLDRSAFDHALRDSDVRFLVNHDPSQLLGRQKSGTLRMGVTDEGLDYEVDLPDTQVAHDVKVLVSRGDLDGGSFGFLPGEDRWGRAGDGRQVRTHTLIKRLLDLSVVTYPAYEGTAVALRSMPDFEVQPPNLRAQLIRARARLLQEEVK